MAASVTQKQQKPEISALILRSLRQMGVAALPRNYELLYDAYTGGHPELAAAISALGTNVSQKDLDLLGCKYLGRELERTAVDRAHLQISAQLEELLGLLKKEQRSLESYGRLLDETHARISAKSLASTELLEGAIAVLSKATGVTLAEGIEIATTVGERSNEVAALKQELDEFKRIAKTDALTKVANRRAFDEAIAQIYHVPSRAPFFALLLIDIDNFKSLNDTFGHPVGDRVLAIIANVIHASLRRDSFVARTGGEEFAVILRDTSEAEALIVAERIRGAVAGTPLRNSKTATDYGPVTISIGVCMGDRAAGSDDLYRKSDIALYVAKACGRNRAEIYTEQMEAGSLSDRFIYRKTVG